MHILLVGVNWKPASAQEGSQAQLAPIDGDDFPHLTSYLDVRNPEGDFVFGLEKHDVSIIEDGVRISLAEFEHLRSGVQLVLAVSPGPAFDIRDVNGISRYDYLSQALLDWGNARRGSSIDDLSIVLAGGPEIAHTSEPDEWIAVLSSYASGETNTSPDFDILGRALDLAADPTVSPGMERAVLFVTPLPEQDISLGLQSLAARASQQGVRIFIWLIASSELFTSPEAEQLAILSEQTGGKLYAYSGQEPIPFLEEYLEQLRNTYFLSYDSHITSSGPHIITAEVNLNGAVINSPQQDLDLEVLPPNVAFISPPMEIERANPDPDGEDSELLLPDSQELELLIEFPDGHRRALKRTSLLVDGIVAETNSSEPFDRFTWDLSEHSIDGEHILQAEVEDILGLTNRSMDNSVKIVIGDSSRSAMGIISENRSLFAGVIVAVSGAILLLVLIIGGRLRPGFWKELRRKRKYSDPVTQPVELNSEPEPARRSKWIHRFQWSQRRIATKPFAQLIPLSDSNQEESSPPIAITRERMTFGNDPDQVDQVLEENSVEAWHATLKREAEGVYRISDEGSTAGTWVNFTPVSQGGMLLEQGDLIHFGRAGFRFVMRDTKQVRKPVRRPEEPFP
jgi:hypothetical protein